MIDRRSLSAVCLLAACTLGCQDVTRSESDLPGTYVLEMVDNHLLPVQGGGVNLDCRIIGGGLTLYAAGTFALADTLDCPPGDGPAGSAELQTGGYSVVGNVLGMSSGFTSGGYNFGYSGPVFGEHASAVYSSKAIALDPTRYYGDTIARKRVYIRQRGTEADTIAN